MAEPIIINWAVWIQSGAIGLGFYFGGTWMARGFKEIKDSLAEKVSEKTCDERTKKCSKEKCRKIDAVEKKTKDLKQAVDKETGELWKVTNHHGHKALDDEGSQVVRREP